LQQVSRDLGSLHVKLDMPDWSSSPPEHPT
jgi:hypothetical protein